MLLPNTALFLGALAALGGLPLLGKTIYSEDTYVVWRWIAWPLAALMFIIVVALQVGRRKIGSLLYQDTQGPGLSRQGSLTLTNGDGQHVSTGL